jgi:hypothetical protein
MKTVLLTKSPHLEKKFRVVLENGKSVNFGARGYQDFTQHKNPERMRLYLIRHKSREHWGPNNINTAGFWSRWLLWSKPSLQDAIKLMNKKFNIHIVNKV